MAQEKRPSFPKMAEINWWRLRKQFHQRVPGQVTKSYVASALKMQDQSANANVISPMRSIGLIDETGAPTNLAFDWRDDSKYSDVCKTIITNLYPQELRDLYHDKSAPLDDVKSWFMNYCHVGGQAGVKLAKFYLLLLDADTSKAEEVINTASKTPAPKTKQSTKKSTSKKKVEKPRPEETTASEEPKTDEKLSLGPPSLHIDIQIHISPETTAEQIDKIFESMSKHLKGFGSK